MSLKRYAILAAVSYHNNQQHNKNATMTMPMTTIGATTTTTATQFSELQQNEVLTTMGTLFMSSSSASASATANTNTTNSSSIISNSQASNSLTNYYGGGLGLFHQQNLRGSTGLLNGISSGNGHMGTNTYTNVVNGNVNLLLGGAMLSLVTTILCVVCYCCHRNIKKRTEAAYRQQRQWLDNDPNMEIYSVEQCYETAGLFLGDSTDGLATMPTLHHEPPPSYDAVLLHEQQLLQQQQQQQLLLQHELQRSSPPPGYRSSLDVSNLVVTNALTHGRGIPDGQMAICELSAPIGEPCAGGSSCSNNNNSNGLATATEGITALQANNNSNNIQQLTNARGNSMNTSSTAVLNMKRVLNAQSCCSLQRAEVENMWNAAAAALAARGGISSNNGVNGNSNTEMNALTPPLMRCTRGTLDCYGVGSSAGGTRLPTNELGRRYWNHNYYRRGCPLCGKFRYDAEDVLCASTESGLDNVTAAATTSAGMATANMSASNERLNVNIDDGQRQRNRNYYYYDDNANDNCTGCNAAAAYAAANRAAVANAAAGHVAYVVDAATNEIPSEEAVVSACAAQPGNSSSSINDNNNDCENDTNGNNSSAIASISVDNIDENANANHTHQQQEQQQQSDISTVAGKDLNAINDNGIICLDMSKIIDKTGLPTYEGAIKLESSGYV